MLCVSFVLDLIMLPFFVSGHAHTAVFNHFEACFCLESSVGMFHLFVNDIALSDKHLAIYHCQLTGFYNSQRHRKTRTKVLACFSFRGAANVACKEGEIVSVHRRSDAKYRYRMYCRGA